MQSIAVFCGSAKGNNPLYAEKAYELGQFLAQQGLVVVYGAGNIGLMGEVADGALDAGGQVIGSIPTFLKEREVCHTSLTELFVTDSMHQRKQIMADRADAFLILPGGFGTLDEFFEILTWKQVHLHHCPIGLLNWNNYYQHLIAHLDFMVQEGFLKPSNRDLVVIDSEIAPLLERMNTPTQPSPSKWLDRT